MTDQNGNYIFSDLSSGTQYYLAIPSNQLDQYGLLSIDNETFVFVANDQGDEIVDSDANLLNTHCNNVIVPVAASSTNHSFDIGLSESSGFDLALRKTVLDQSIARVNDIIPFRISIFNQGGIPAKDIKVVDYIPEGYEFVESENQGWTYSNGMASRTINETILPSASHNLTIKLRMVSSDLSKLVNVAEIADARDHNGNVVTDDDSVMDEDRDNDMGGQVNSGNDDNISDDGTLDEDDSDPAIPNIFDLALKQSYEDANCLTGGNEIVVKINVYNQGNVASRSFEVTNYGSPVLNFIKSKNPDWTLDNGLLTYQGGELAPGTKTTIDLVYQVYNTSGNIEVTNYAEISSSIPQGRNVSEDSDSTPDQDEKNDKGGKPNSSDDDYIFGSADVEEDDHDPITIRPRSVDLALIVTSDSRSVEEGQEVCFDITVTNQGYMPVSSIQLAEYLPRGLELIGNQGWSHDRDNIYKKDIDFVANLNHSEEHVEQVCMMVTDLTDIFAIENFAEISLITGICGEDLSTLDIDSKADDEQNNDPGGRPETNTDDSVDMLPTIDEDDHDVALLINVVTTIANACDYKCPATEPGNGIIRSTIEINAPVGMTWRIDQGVGYYDESSTAGNPVALSIGDILPSSPGANPGEAVYTFTGAFLSGKPYTARFKSDNNDFAYVNSGGVCAYKSFPVTGPVALCNGGIATYILQDNSSDDYSPSISGGGVIMNTSSDGKTVTVDWNGASGNHELRFVNDDDCTVEPIVYNVVTGTADNAMKCKSSINLSLDQDCEVEVTPDHIIAGVPTPDAAYAVMLTLNGEAIPANIVNSTHVGKTITAKLIEGCGGNSCWGEILVEDKMIPTILCEDVTVSCYKAAQYRGPVALDNCGDPVVLHLLDSAYFKQQCNSITGYFEKSYQAEDASGNLSAICHQRIDVERVNLDSIKFPDNMTMLNALACSDYLEDENGNPHPSITGIPQLEGDDIWPNFDNFCNLVVTYEDEGPYPFECAEKIIRKWVVWDESCIADPRMAMKEQTLVIADRTGPTITCPDPISAITSYTNCEARVTLPAATGIDDDCTADPQVDVVFPGGIRMDANGGFDIFLMSGIHTIRYTVTDDCKNSTSCETTVTVKDDAAPLAVCDQNTTVALNSQGEAYIYAMTIDDGSYDACGIVEMLVKRADNGSACGTFNPDFAPTIDFCCEDVSETVPVIVIMEVSDENGNKNTCETNVFVQDKTPPAISCPHDVSISCLDHYDLDSLDIYGTATAVDACEMDTMYVEISENVNSCRVGYIDRTFFASDGSTTVNCTQRITVEKTDTFDFDDIIKPLDYDVANACLGGSLEPDSLPPGFQKPQLVNEGICDLVSFAHEDRMWQFNDTLGTCFKIRRRWTVINHCDTVDARDPNNIILRELVFDQIIKVSKTMPPTITSDLSDKSVFLDSASCTMGTIVLEAEAEGCLKDEQLNWSYEIFVDGTTPLPRVGPFPGNFASASGMYPLGNHIIQWSFEDNCGNVTTESQNFSIINNKKPSAICIDTVIVALVAMDTNNDDTIDLEMGCIWPDPLNVSSSHPCYPDDTLEYSFNEFNTLDSICFDCFDLGQDSVFLYVIDPDGNFDVCKVTVLVQDNNNDDFCPTIEDCIEFPEPVFIEDCSTDTTTIALGETVIDPDCACDEYTVSYKDQEPLEYPNAGCEIFTRDWTVTFTCGSNEQTFTYAQVITKVNDKDPILECPADVNVFALPTNCESPVSFLGDLAATVNDACNTGIMITNDSPFADAGGADASGIYPVAGSPHVITFTATDLCGNTGTCQTTVTVMDNLPPEPVCNDITVSINSVGEYTLTQDDINDIAEGSTDNCMNPMFSVMQDEFDCEDVGSAIEVTLTVSDGNLSSTCTANVTVEDNEAPNAVCNDITVSLLADGTYTLSEADLEDMSDGSSDNCDEFEVTVDQDMFECPTTLGINSVTVTVEDDSGLTDDCISMVTVVDDMAPTAVCNDITVNLFATGQIALSNAHINNIANGSNDNCDINFSVTPNTFDCSTTGDNVVLLTVTEVGGSQLQDTCTATVTVNDVLPPTADCNDITITLNSNGLYEFDSDDLDAITLPNSSDNCSFVASSEDVFDCSDVNNPTTGTITITDPSGLTDECVIDVTVENNDTLMCVSNPAITVALPNNPPASTYTLNIDEIDAGSGAGCLSIMREIDVDDLFCNDVTNPVPVTLTVWVPGVDTATCTTIVTVIDTFPPAISCLDTMVNCDLFDGDFEALDGYSIVDNCMNTVEVDTLSTTIALNGCGLGLFTREFMVTDVGGNSDNCTMTVSVVGPSDPVELADFTLPADITLDNCSSIDVMTTDSVFIDNSQLVCEFFEISFVDDPAMLPGSCMDTVTRTWTMTDTCSNTSLTYDQQIVVIDTVAPSLSITMDTVFIANPNNECELFVDLSGIVMDGDCEVSNTTYTNSGQFADDSNSIDASGTYSASAPFGTYDIVVTAEDGCGNTDSISYVLVIEQAVYMFNCDKVIEPIDTITLMACVPVSDVAQLTGACDTNYTIVLYDELADTSYTEPDTMKFGCDRIGDNPFKVYLFQDSVLVDSCTVRSDVGRTLITITDPTGACDTTTTIARVGGLVTTQYSTPVPAVRMQLGGSDLEYQMTNSEGEYAFPDMPSGGDYMVKPYKNDDVLNGVSTLDLILIQRHILKLDELKTNYNLIAADVNNDNSINVVDLLELRKVILGINAEFKNNMSWKVIDQSYEFPGNNPFDENYPLEHEVNNVIGNMIVDFVGVKIGDVNGSYEPNVRPVQVDSRASAKMVIKDEIIEANDDAELRFGFEGVGYAYGLQTSIEIDNLSDLEGVRSSDDNVTIDYHIIGQTIVLSIYSDELIDMSSFEILISCQVSKATNVSEMISLDTKLASEVYTSDLNANGLGLDYRSENYSNVSVVVDQNKPNPWSNQTYIDYSVPKDGQVNVSITDMSGRVLRKQSLLVEKGSNRLEINSDDVDNKTGVFMVIFDFEGKRYVHKMIRVQ